MKKRQLQIRKNLVATTNRVILLQGKITYKIGSQGDEEKSLKYLQKFEGILKDFLSELHTPAEVN